MTKLLIGASGQIKVIEQENGNIVIDIDPTFAGQVSINTVGTIQIGDWQANIISPEFGGTGCNNQNSYLQLGGSTIISGPLILNCVDNENTELNLPAKGTVATIEKSLQIENSLSELSTTEAQKAFDHISPNKQKGDITYFDGTKNISLNAGDKNSYLTVNANNDLYWKNTPNYLRYIINSNKTYEGDTIHFSGDSFLLSKEQQLWSDVFSTKIELDSKIESLTDLKKSGFLFYTEGADEIKTQILLSGNGINITYPNEELSNTIISIDKNYVGNDSIKILGKVESGEWKAKIIEPQFGGTGENNKHPIKLGGYIDTTCPFTVTSPNHINGVNFYAEFGSVLTLPEMGTVATKEESLQSANNLHDVTNPQEAFRHISPTQTRGDIIVRGYGDYDINHPIGKDGQVLTVNSKKLGCIEWIDLNLEEIVEYEVNRILADKEKQLIEKTAKELNKKNTNMTQQTCLNAIMMQLDYMIRTGQIKPLKEMQNALHLWIKDIVK